MSVNPTVQLTSSHLVSFQIFLMHMYTYRASLVSHTVENLPAMWETEVQSQGRGDPLEKGMATHSSILVWEISWTEEPDGLQPMASQIVGHN